jgi:hypothetical protein
MRQHDNETTADDEAEAGCLQDMFKELHKDKDGLFTDRTVLFCWEHKTIPSIVACFEADGDDDAEPVYWWGSDPKSGVSKHITMYPSLWKGDRKLQLWTVSQAAMQHRGNAQLCKIHRCGIAHGSLPPSCGACIPCRRDSHDVTCSSFIVGPYVQLVP